MKTVILTIALLLTSVTAVAQNGQPIDTTACFSDLLKNRFDFEQNADLKYRLLSLWNRELYESSKSDSAIFGVYGADNFEASLQKVLRELQEKNQSIDYNKATSLHAARLDPNAAAVINPCLERRTSGYGIYTTIEVEDQRYFDVKISWKSKDGGSLKFKKQEIFNGVVLDDNKSHPTLPLALPDGVLPQLFDPEIPSGSSRTVRVERSGPDQPVIFKFSVSPNIPFETITVAPVPEKVIYVKNERKTNRTTDQPLKAEWIAQTWVNNNGLVQTYDLGDTKKHYRITHHMDEIEKDPTAVFTNVRCEKYGEPADYADLDGANPSWATIAPGIGDGTRDASCTGWWIKTGRSIKMVATYQLTEYEPQKQKWPAWEKLPRSRVPPFPCPQMPSVMTATAKDVRSDINVNVGELGPIKVGEIGVKTDVLTKSIFEKFPNADRLLTLDTLVATYCPMLRNSDLSDVEKIDRWEAFQSKVLDLKGAKNGADH